MPSPSLPSPGRRDRQATAIALLAVALKGAALAALAWWSLG
jgi:hypothetical protein